MYFLGYKMQLLPLFIFITQRQENNLQTPADGHTYIEITAYINEDTESSLRITVPKFLASSSVCLINTENIKVLYSNPEFYSLFYP